MVSQFHHQAKKVSIKSDHIKFQKMCQLRYITEHIKEFSAKNSHYSRNKNESKKYLSTLLNVTIMHQLYLERCKEQHVDDRSNVHCIVIFLKQDLIFLLDIPKAILVVYLILNDILQNIKKIIPLFLNVKRQIGKSHFMIKLHTLWIYNRLCRCQNYQHHKQFI